MSNGHIVSRVNVIPSIFSEAPKFIRWGGFVKDVKLRPTSKYQLAMSGAKKLVMAQLEPSTGQVTTELVNTGSFIRDYICLEFSKPSEEFLFAGT